MSFEGKVVIVTGSSFGIGRGIAKAFGCEGASVTIHGRSLESLNVCFIKFNFKHANSSRTA